MFTLSAEEQYEILAEVARRLIADLPDDAVKVTYETVMLTPEYRNDFRYLDAEGGVHSTWAPMGAGQGLPRLRAGMYQPGKGTWIGLTLTVRVSDGRFAAEYNYDTDPESDDPPERRRLPEQWSTELGHHPRDPEHIPQWWLDRIAAAPNVFGAIRDLTIDAVAERFAADGWKLTPQYRGEYMFSRDWAEIKTLTDERLVRWAGRVDPDRVTELEALLSGWGLDFEGEVVDPYGQIQRQLDNTGDGATT